MADDSASRDGDLGDRPPAEAARRLDGIPAGRLDGRLDGVDVARAVAILGMLTVHFGPYGLVDRAGRASPAEWLYASFYGKASVLFVVVAGLGVGLLVARSSVREVRARLVYRAVWLVPLGVWLQTLDHPVAVILQYYGLYFLALAPFVGRHWRTVVAWAVGWWLAGAAAVLMVRQWAPDWLLFERGDPPLGIPGELVIGGYYPLVTWMAPMLVGTLLARADLQDRRVQWRMVLWGAAVLAGTVAVSRMVLGGFGAEASEGSWWFALSTRGHSEMPLAVLGATGAATAILGGCLAAVRVARLAVTPLAASGRLALTIYVGHLFVFHRWPDLFPVETVGAGTTKIMVFAAVTSAGAMAWLAMFERGPLEAVVRWPWRHVVQPWARQGGDPSASGVAEAGDVVAQVGEAAPLRHE